MSDRDGSRWKIIAIVIGAGCLYLLGNGRFTLWDRDEPRYAQTARQMLQGGDWVVPKFLDKPRTAKPVLIYWCEAASMRLFGDNTFAARLPSALAMTLTLTLLALVIWRAIGPSRAMWTVLVLASSGIVVYAAKSCFVDSVMLLWLVAAQILTYAIWRGSASWAVVILLAIAIGLGGLTKGPVVVGVLGFTILVLAALRRIDGRRSERLRLSAPQVLVGLAIIAAICGPWLYMMQQRVPDYLRDTFWKEVFDRARRPQEGHKGPPGFYLVWIWVTFFPWSLLLPATLVQAWKRRHIPAVRFALASVVGPWLMFELVQTKLPHYSLPLIPPLAFLTADMLVRASRRIHDDITNGLFPKIVAVWAVVVVIAAAVPWASVVLFPNETPPVAWWWMFIMTLIAIEYVRQIYVHFRDQRPTAAAAVMGIGMLIYMAALFGAYLPNAHYLRVSQRVADVLRAHGAAGEIRMISYKEPSLAYYQGGTIREERDNRFLETHPASDWPDWVIFTLDLWAKTPPEIQAQFEVVDLIKGWNYSNRGKIVEVLVLRNRNHRAGVTTADR